MRLTSDTRPWFKEPWPWILMAGPFIVVVAGFVTAWLAFKNNDGLVEDDYYKQGMTINQQLKRDDAATALGLQAEVMRSGPQIRVLLTARAPLALPEKLNFRVLHPTRSGQDQLVALVLEGQGLYTGKLATAISGRWHTVLEEPSGIWRLQGDWRVDAVENLRLGAGGLVSKIDQPVTGR